MAEEGADYFSSSDEDAADASLYDSATDDLSDEGRCTGPLIGSRSGYQRLNPFNDFFRRTKHNKHIFCRY